MPKDLDPIAKTLVAACPALRVLVPISAMSSLPIAARNSRQ